MARQHARILCSIWQDPDFRARSQQAQWLYMVLVSQPTVSNVGVLPYTPRPWSLLAMGVDEDDIKKMLHELEDARFLIVDEDAGEVLIRSFMRNDGVTKNENVYKNALKIARQVQSPRIRREIAVELRRIGRDGASAVAAEIDAPAPSPSADAVATTSERPRDVVATTSERRSSTVEDRNSTIEAVPCDEHRRDDVETTSERRRDDVATARGAGAGAGVSAHGYVQSGSPSERGRTRARATRLPDAFAVTDAMREWATEHAPAVNLDYETDKFRDYWGSESGQRATKRDWSKAWRNWIRKAQEHTGRQHARQPQDRGSTKDRRVLQTQTDLRALLCPDEPQTPAIEEGTG